MGGILFIPCLIQHESLKESVPEIKSDIQNSSMYAEELLHSATLTEKKPLKFKTATIQTEMLWHFQAKNICWFPLMLYIVNPCQYINFIYFTYV